MSLRHIVFKKTETIVETSNYKNGVYFIHIFTGVGCHTWPKSVHVHAYNARSFHNQRSVSMQAQRQNQKRDYHLHV